MRGMRAHFMTRGASRAAACQILKSRFLGDWPNCPGDFDCKMEGWGSRRHFMSYLCLNATMRDTIKLTINDVIFAARAYIEARNRLNKTKVQDVCPMRPELSRGLASSSAAILIVVAVCACDVCMFFFRSLRLLLCLWVRRTCPFVC